MKLLSVRRRSSLSSLALDRLGPYLQLVRPANLATAMADILAGYAVAGLADHRALLWLLAATLGLYGGGIVLNDVFDARLDAVERPERPIPRGAVAVGHAALFGALLLIAGVLSGFQANRAAGSLSLLIALSVWLYDAKGKTEPAIGFLGMGVCRSLNLLLGMSAAPWLIGRHWPLALTHFFYITSVVVLSRGEVHGGRRSTGLLAIGLLIAAVGILLLAAIGIGFDIAALFPFLFLFSIRVVSPFRQAASRPDAGVIRAAVKAGILSLILLDAAIAAGSAGLLYGSAILPLSWGAGRMARRFAVT